MCAMGLEKLTRLAKVDYGFPFDSSSFTDDSVYMPLIRIRDIKPAKASTYYEGEYCDRYVVRKGDILVGMDGEFNLERWNDRDGLLNQRILRIKAIDGLSDESYLYHLLAPLFKNIEKKVQGGSVKHLSAKIVENLYIPYVDFEEQVLIGKQLDTFTTLISNLGSELDMRRKQYEHYREVLFEEYEEYKVELGSFGQVEKAKNKKRITENAYSITQKGLVPTKDFFKEKTRVTSNDTSNYYIVQKNWFVYSPSRIDVGSINYLRDEGPAIVSPIDVVFSIDTNVCNPHFLLNYLQSQDGMFQILKYRIGVEGTGRRSLPFTDFAKIQVPLPSKQTQQEIVEKLDAFEQLIQSLETEIKLRKQQYEYYREKLLTFEK